MSHSWSIGLILGTMIGVAACNEPTGPSITPSKILPVASPSVSSANQDPVAAVSAVQFDGSRSTSSASGGITAYSWNFGDGSQASGAQVQHIFNSAGTKSVTLTVTDANGTSAPASTTVTIKDLTGIWQAQFNVQTRTYTLVQNGSAITGMYTNTLLLRQEWPVNGSVDTSRRFTITATYPGETTVVLSNATIDATVSSFTGVTFGGSADNQTLTYRRVQ